MLMCREIARKVVHCVSVVANERVCSTCSLQDVFI